MKNRAKKLSVETQSTVRHLSAGSLSAVLGGTGLTEVPVKGPAPGGPAPRPKGDDGPFCGDIRDLEREPYR